MGGLGVVVAMLVGGQLLGGRGIDAEAVFVAEVQGGQFDVVVAADGVIRPKVEEVVAARVEGTAKDVPVQSGQTVTADAPLVVLENDEVEDAYVHAVWEARVAAADAAADENAAENTIQDIEASLARTRLELKKQELFIAAQDALPKLSIPKVDYEVRKLEASNLARVVDIEVARLERYRTFGSLLRAAREAKRLKAENLLAAAEKRRNNLTVRSPISGTASVSTDIVIGRRVARGDAIGRIVGAQGYFAELEVPEYWAGAVAISDLATVETSRGELAGEVVAIDPDVVDGRVLVKVDLGQLPDPLLPGLTVNGRIVTDSISDTVYVRKPVHARERASQELYRYEAASGSYVATDVVFGRASATEIQVVLGLSPGDRVIVSDVAQLSGSDAIQLR